MAFDWKKREREGHLGNGKPKPTRNKSNRFSPYNAFYDRLAGKAQPIDHAVYGYLFRHADGKNVVQTSHGNIAKALGKDRRTIIRSVKRLEQIGAVKCVWRSGLGREQGNKYQLIEPKP